MPVLRKVGCAPRADRTVTHSDNEWWGKATLTGCGSSTESEPFFALLALTPALSRRERGKKDIELVRMRTKCKMTKLKYNPVTHNQKTFLEKASKRRGFRKAYAVLEAEYALAHEMLSARTRAGLTQEAVADRMGTTKSPRRAQ